MLKLHTISIIGLALLFLAGVFLPTWHSLKSKLAKTFNDRDNTIKKLFIIKWGINLLVFAGAMCLWYYPCFKEADLPLVFSENRYIFTLIANFMIDGFVVILGSAILGTLLKKITNG